jgi:hypothetical protein
MQAIVRIAGDDVGEGAAAIDPELPAWSARLLHIRTLTKNAG